MSKQGNMKIQKFLLNYDVFPEFEEFCPELYDKEKNLWIE